MKTILLRGAGLTLLLLIVLTLWNKYERVIFPTSTNLYILESRSGGNFAKDLQRLLPETEQRRAGFHIIVTQVDRSNVSTTEEQWRATLDTATNSPGSETLFFELGSPTATSKKLLRAEIERRFVDIERPAILGRVIAFVGVRGESVSQACAQLSDDWEYLHWNFGGIALTVDDDTLSLVGSCLPNLLTELATSQTVGL